MSASYKNLLKDVQTVAQLDSEAEAENAIRTTLEILKHRIMGDEASQLADQLPEEAGQYLRGEEGTPGEPFGINDFYQRMAKQGNIDIMQAPLQARAVVSAMASLVTPGEFEDVKSNLPDDFSELFLVAK